MWQNWQFTEVWSQMRVTITPMMHNPPATVEQLEGTDWTRINKINIMNHFCMVTIIGQSKPWGICGNKNYTVQWVYGASTIFIARTNWIGRHGSMLTDDLWYCQRKCKLFIKCSLSHSQQWVHWFWCVITASQKLQEHWGMLDQCHIWVKPWFDFFAFVGTINHINLTMEI